MRKILRNIAKAKMTKMGYSKVNKRMGKGRWREIVGAYPTDVITGRKMPKNFRGSKRTQRGSHYSLFAY